MAPTTTWKLLATSTSVIFLSYAIMALLKRKSKSHLKFKVKPNAAQSISSEEDMPTYDVVIIGGGTAGCVLASRLSEDPSISVLLLEAGGSGRNIPLSIAPGGYIGLFYSDVDYKLRTIPQIHAGGRARSMPQGKLLGGGSSINAMMFHAGAPTDYDEWALSGEEGASEWAYDQFHKYFLKFEKFVPHKLFPLVDASLRGSSGPVQVGYFGNFSNVSAQFLSACEKVGIRQVPDINTAVGTLGASKIMTYIDSRGHRVSMESAYLTPDVLKRPNLTVATRMTVTRILFDTGKRAVGVEFSGKKDGPRYRVRARKEVVLSAGAIQTPKILMLSGVGGASQLKSMSIPVVHDLPGVGAHLMDHPSVNVRFRVKPGESLNHLNPVNAAKNLHKLLIPAIQWQLFGTGPLTTNIAEAVAFVRSVDPQLFPDSETIEDATSAPNAPDIELFSSPCAWTDHGHGPVPAGALASFAVICVRPTSKGTVTLKSTDPFDPPVIDPNYLQTRHDVDVLVRGLKLVLRIAQTAPLSALLIATETDPLLDHQLHAAGDAVLEREVRARVETLYHPTSTARMAPLKDGGVVDPYLRVHGVEGLRVVDASIFPTIVAGHTAAPTIAVAEKAADIIKRQLKR